MKYDLIFTCLEKLYPPGKFNSLDPFRALIATVLSQRTRDEITEKAAKKLFSRYDTPSVLSKADVKDIEDLIREVGFYRVKAVRIKEIARIIDDQYSGKVPEDLNELLALPGVGRKTANCVLVYGFGKQAIAVDTHVHRISNRLGFVSTKTPQETEMRLQEVLPEKYWLLINELMVRFGQDICRPVSPKCGNCTISRYCPSRISKSTGKLI